MGTRLQAWKFLELAKNELQTINADEVKEVLEELKIPMRHLEDMIW